MEENSVTPFVFQGEHTVRTIDEGNQKWFCVNDICHCLGLKNRPQSLIKPLDEDEKMMHKIYASNKNRQMWFVSESGVYFIIGRSNKPEAKDFMRWLRKEVLPAIRKTGQYRAPGAPVLIVDGQPVSEQEAESLVRFGRTYAANIQERQWHQQQAALHQKEVAKRNKNINALTKELFGQLRLPFAPVGNTKIQAGHQYLS